MSARLRTLVAVTFALAVVLLGAPTSLAHSGFVSSDPADGTILAQAPDAITVTFTEPPDPAISWIQVVDSGGQPVEGGELDRPSPNTLRLVLPTELLDGTYTVPWLAVSTVDGHYTTDAFAFSVGAATPAPPEVHAPSSSGVTWLGIAGRVALYAGLSLLVALGVVGGWAFGGRLRGARIVAMVGAVLAASGPFVLLAAEVAQIGSPTSTFLASDTGRPFVRLMIAAVVAAGFAVVAAARTNRVTLGLAGLAALVAMFFRAASGHAAAEGLVPELGQTVHLASVGTWIGGLVLLAMLLRERRADPPAAEARRFSQLALVAVVLVVLTGTVRAIQETGGFGALAETIRTGYGQVLLVKIALAAGLIALGAVNRFRSVPRIAAGDPRLLRRIVRAELVVASGVFVLAGALTSLPPGGVEEAEPPPRAAVVAEGSDFATTVRVRLEASPGAAGPNAFTADVTDYDSGEPADVDAVTLRFERVGADLPTTSLELTLSGERWTGEGSPLSIAGTWTVTAQLRTGAESTTVPLVLTTAPAGSTSSVAEVPGLPGITTVTFVDQTSAQLYVDPGTQGPNQVHLTAFDQTGEELQLVEAALVAIGPDGTPRPADVLRFDPGHYVANLDLQEGAWTFDFTATTVDGDAMQATLRQTIGAPS